MKLALSRMDLSLARFASTVGTAVTDAARLSTYDHARRSERLPDRAFQNTDLRIANVRRR